MMPGLQSCLLKAKDLEPVQCSWSTEQYQQKDVDAQGRALCITLSQRSSAITGAENTVQLDASASHADPPGNQAPQAFMVACVERVLQIGKAVNVVLVLASQDGYLPRTDVVERRFEGCEFVHRVTSFVNFGEQVKMVTASSISDLISSAVAGMDFKDLVLEWDRPAFTRTAVQELENRLKFPILSTSPFPQRRLIWVEGRGDIEVCRRIYEAAYALGIKLVIVDNPGHWLEDDSGPFSHLRESFLPMNIAADVGFTERLTELVQNFIKDVAIDGIMTISDARLYGVAKTCETLGYPTSPSSAYDLAGDKYKTRSMEPDGDQSFRVDSVEELKGRISNAQSKSIELEYPLIVKPCFGWGSECVAKVTNYEDLLAAAAKASARHLDSPQHRSDFMVEPYIDGPEVDANFALLEDRIVFYEVADDFPSPGDAENSSLEDNFQETANLLPTGLPPNEVEVVRDAILQSLQRMGFSHGTFHCEGRLRNSSRKYARIDDQGSWDLIEDPAYDPNQKTTFFLHEINARPAGYLESVSTALTYGVDYYTLQLLYSLGDMERYQTLSQPFANGRQWHLALLLIPGDEPGVMQTPDATLDMMERHSDLAAAIVDHNTVIKGGSRYLGPAASQLSYLAYISIVSRESRQQCLRLSEKVRREFKYEIVKDK